jgi:hypothetical protein
MPPVPRGGAPTKCAGQRRHRDAEDRSRARSDRFPPRRWPPVPVVGGTADSRFLNWGGQALGGIGSHAGDLFRERGPHLWVSPSSSGRRVATPGVWDALISTRTAGSSRRRSASANRYSMIAWAFRPLYAAGPFGGGTRPARFADRRSRPGARRWTTPTLRCPIGALKRRRPRRRARQSRAQTLSRRVEHQIHLAADGHARHLAFTVTAGQAGDAPAFATVMSGIRVPRRGLGRPRTRPLAVQADRACSSRAIAPPAAPGHPRGDPAAVRPGRPPPSTRPTRLPALLSSVTHLQVAAATSQPQARLHTGSTYSADATQRDLLASHVIGGVLMGESRVARAVRRRGRRPL